MRNPFFNLPLLSNINFLIDIQYIDTLKKNAHTAPLFLLSLVAHTLYIGPLDIGGIIQRAGCLIR